MAITKTMWGEEEERWRKEGRREMEAAVTTRTTKKGKQGLAVFAVYSLYATAWGLLGNAFLFPQHH